MTTMNPLRLLAAALVFSALIAGCESPPAVEKPPERPEIPALPPQAAEPELTGTELILNQIVALLAGGDYEKAIAKFDEIEGEDAASVEIGLLKASVYLSAGKPREARPLIRRLLETEPDNPDLLFALASVEYVEGRNREYRALLDRINKEHPNHVDTLISLGNLYMQNNSWRNAASSFDRALGVDAENAEALLGRAQVYRHTRAPERAEELLSRAIGLYPNLAALYSERAQLYRYYGDYPSALTDLARARELNPADYWAACDMGSVYLSMNQKTEALAAYNQAARLDPENFLAYVYLAGLKDDLGDYEGAERDYITLARLKPEYYFAFEGVGIHKMKNKEWAAGRDAFTEAWNRAKDQWAYALLASACWMRAERIQAPRQFLETALRGLQRESLEWYMLRLFHDLTGDTDVAARVDRERSPINKARMSFYLAQYYDIRGSKTLADRYFLQVKQLDQKAIPEWRLNEWAIEERGLSLQ